LYCLPS
jgi:hypothetical protein